jgi:Ras-related protein Rab-7A
LVYDITNAKSFENLDKWREGFIEHAAPSDPKQFPFVLLGNKVDREPERKVQAARA